MQPMQALGPTKSKHWIVNGGQNARPMVDPLPLATIGIAIPQRVQNSRELTNFEIFIMDNKGLNVAQVAKELRCGSLDDLRGQATRGG
jgi:hypothetical protein